MYTYIFIWVCLYFHRSAPAGIKRPPPVWHLHDIAITNIVWFTASKGGVGKRAYIAQWSCNSIVIG